MLDLDAIDETPDVVIDLDRVRANLERAARLAREAGIQLRPHAKTHKMVEVARLQVDAGAAGLQVAKLGEAEVFADAGIDELFVGYPLVGARACTDSVSRRDLMRFARAVTFAFLKGPRRVGLSGCIAALVVVAAASAGGAVVKVPAPAVGKVRVELLTIKASKQPSLKVTNLPALGKGFGGVAAVGRSSKSSGTYKAYVVMYMGNNSTSPASTVDVQVSGGTPAGTPKDESGDCKVLFDLYNADYPALGLVGLWFFTKFDVNGSKPKSEFASDLKYQRQQQGCH